MFTFGSQVDHFSCQKQMKRQCLKILVRLVTAPITAEDICKIQSKIKSFFFYRFYNV